MANPLGVNEKAYRHFERAQSALDKGDWDKAIAEASKAVALDPEFGEARVLLGAAYSHAGRLKEACAAFRTALDHPHRTPVPMILDMLIGALAADESFAEAYEVIERREGMAPPPDSLAGVKGRCLEALERYPEALAAFRQAVEEEPEESVYWCLLGEMAAECGDKATIVEACDVLEWMALDRAAHFAQSVELCRVLRLSELDSDSEEDEKGEDPYSVGEPPGAIEPLASGALDEANAELAKAAERGASAFETMAEQQEWLLAKVDRCEKLPRPLRAAYRKAGKAPLRFVFELYTPALSREQAAEMAAQLEQLEELGPPVGFAAFKAFFLEKAGKDEDALDAYQDAVIECPNEPGLWLRLAQTAARCGDTGTAMEVCSELEQLAAFATEEHESLRDILAEMEGETE